MPIRRPGSSVIRSLMPPCVLNEHARPAIGRTGRLARPDPYKLGLTLAIEEEHVARIAPALNPAGGLMLETGLDVVAHRREPVDVFRERDLGGANAPVGGAELLHVDRVDASRLIEVRGRAIAALFSRRSGFLVGLEVPVASLEKHAVTQRPGVAKVVQSLRVSTVGDCLRADAGTGVVVVGPPVVALDESLEPHGRRWCRRQLEQQLGLVSLHRGLVRPTVAR